ncbi:uncharacterized protein LOC144431167 [Styela clava]
MKNQKILAMAEDSEFRADILQRGAELLLSSFAGMATFPTILGLMQNFVWKPIRVTANKKIAPLCGAFSLTVASACAATSFVIVEKHINARELDYFLGKDEKETFFNTCSYAAFTIIVFKLFGGRLKSLCPSHILHPGAFAVEHVALSTLTARVTKTHLSKIQLLGERHGCHTCGKRYNRFESTASKLWKKLFGSSSRVKVDYFADHNPPVALAEQYLKRNKSIVGKLYPQCKSCSYFQASQVRLHQANQLKSSNAIITHATRMRLFKLWIPFPVFLQYGLLQIALHRF